MLQVSPVRAFSDNYIWLIRAPAEPAAAIVVDPGDDRPVDAALRAARSQPGSDPRDAPSRRPRRRSRGHWPPGTAPGSSDRPAKKCLAMCRRWTTVTRQHLRHLGLEFSVMAIPGTYARATSPTSVTAPSSAATRFSAPGCGRLFEGTPAQMLDSLDRLAALPDCHAGFTAAMNTRPRTSGSPRAVEPDNLDVREAQAEVASLRERDEVTLPSTLGRERLINPFLRCREPSLRESAERHAGRPLPTAVDVFADRARLERRISLSRNEQHSKHTLIACLAFARRRAAGGLRDDRPALFEPAAVAAPSRAQAAARTATGPTVPGHHGASPENAATAASR